MAEYAEHAAFFVQLVVGHRIYREILNRACFNACHQGFLSLQRQPLLPSCAPLPSPAGGVPSPPKPQLFRLLEAAPRMRHRPHRARQADLAEIDAIGSAGDAGERGNQRGGTARSAAGSLMR
jgi:hypothetical protein